MSPKKIIKSMTALFAGMVFLFAGNALIVSSIGVILKEKGESSLAVGIISSCFFIGALVGTISAHKIISRIGHIRSFGLFGAVFGISAMLHTISDSLIFWALLRFFIGICYYGLLMVIESWLNEKSKNAVRSRILGFYEIVFYLAFGLGILIIALNLSQHTVFILSASLILLSSLPLNLIKIKEPILPQPSPISIPKIFDIAPLAITTSFIAGMLINGFFSMASVFILLQGFDAKSVSYFMFCGVLGGFFAQTIMGIISDKLGRKFAIITCSSIAFFTMLIFAFFKLHLYFQYFLGSLLGVGVFCLYALALARANDMLINKNKSVELGRGVLFCYSLGSLFGPLILGILMQYFQTQGFIWFYIVCLGFLILFAINKPNILNKNLRKKPRNMVLLND
ncbi:MFS transporter [Campylobacter hepaticus]|uniref:MFS transporter n=1 Tax=Campylobacter hepaticus TaxID=1813019 RepID=A0A424Z2Q1_9BACT|nr:MFS transporter [Campylobacter hepaticus]AXP08606.1 MFS transporter [Campylobacter hepaticus]MCZ0772448.1 MFS transporter [Campylobacter hepaticus]MCZ0773916.1 MFS transporter [Campylobacter hepaticus]MCZ0775167.1 MFS transporter [Campylobacter hepaticus]MDX2323330.1 MFS transporter [Campylobacter hepaticus]